MTVVLMPRMQTSRAYEFMGSILRVSHLSHHTRTRHYIVQCASKTEIVTSHDAIIVKTASQLVIIFGKAGN